MKDFERTWGRREAQMMVRGASRFVGAAMLIGAVACGGSSTETESSGEALAEEGQEGQESPPGVAERPNDEEPLIEDSPEASGPELGEVMAIEVQRAAEDRRFTRDAAAIRTVMEAFATETEWARARMPRCRPELWARLVPPSAEGGASVLTCRADSPVYVAFPGAETYGLGEAPSQAVYRALSALELSEAGAVPPTIITERMESLSIEVRAPDGDSVTLRVSGGGEGATAIDAEQAAALVNSLAVSGFFHRSTAYAVPARPEAGDPPEGRAAGEPPDVDARLGEVRLRVEGSAFHHVFREAAVSAVFEHTRSSLEEAATDDAVRGAIARLAPSDDE